MPEVGQLGHPFGPKTLRAGEQRVDARPDPGVQDGGDVPGAGQVPGGDRRADDLGEVQVGEFGGVQGAKQPSGLGESGWRWPGGSAAVTSSR